MAVAGLAVAVPGWAQVTVAARTGVFGTSIAAEGSYLETRARDDGTNGREGVLRLSPGLRWSSRSGLIQGDADYVGDLFFRKGRTSTEGSDYQNTLNARVRAEAVPGRAGVEVLATVRQQAISAYGEQAVSGAVAPGGTGNRAEVGTLSVAPYLRGSLGIAADYELRLGATETRTRDGGATPDSRGTDGRFTLSAPRGRVFGWNVLLSNQRVESRGAAAAPDATENTRARLGLSVMPMPQLQLSVNGGSESIDEGGLAQRHTERTAGVGLLWSPSARTQLAADVEKRHFGTGGRLNFSHRSASTVLAYTYTRDTSFGVDGAAVGAPLTQFQLALAQAGPVTGDPVAHAQDVLADLIRRGLDPNQTVSLSVLGPTFSLVERQDLSFGWLGRRLSVNLRAFTSSTSRFVTALGQDTVADEPVRQRGWTSTLSYRLTPRMAVTLGGQRLMTLASIAGPATDLKSADLGLSNEIGRRTSVRADVRYTVFNSPTDPYRTTSVSASISQRF